jgi:large subunit ribosomal protein L30
MPRKAKSAATEAKGSAGEGRIQIQYYRSFIATPKTHKQMVRSLGLTKLNQIVDRPDNASTRGAVAKIPHLLRIIE